MEKSRSLVNDFIYLLLDAFYIKPVPVYKQQKQEWRISSIKFRMWTTLTKTHTHAHAFMYYTYGMRVAWNSRKLSMDPPCLVPLSKEYGLTNCDFFSKDLEKVAGFFRFLSPGFRLGISSFGNWLINYNFIYLLIFLINFFWKNILRVDQNLWWAIFTLIWNS